MSLNYLVAAARQRTETEKKNAVGAKSEVKQMLDFSSEIDQAAREAKPQWTECRHLKEVGERRFCKRYFSLCAEESCNTKYINAEDKQIDYKRILHGK